MFSQLSCFRLYCLAMALLGLSILGCSKEEASDSGTPAADVVKPTPGNAELQAKLEAKLSQADLLDGQTDKIVTRCASCALSMDGKSEHALKALDYTLHFCTEGCAKRFGENMTESILAMEIPGD